MAKIGRPPKYDNNEQLQNAINDYFENGVTKRKVEVGKGDFKEVIEIPIPTITGLVNHLGFESRQSFYAYENISEFSYTIKRARTIIEQYYEESLSLPGPTGAIFALKNFGWVDKQEVEHSGGIKTDNTITLEIKGESDFTFPETETDVNAS